MNEGIISVRYAKALFLTAKEKGIINEIKDDMLYILELTAMQEVRDLLISPVIQNSVKRSAMKALLKGNTSDITMNLAILTVNNNREMFLPAIARSYIQSANKFNGITKAILTTAAEISDSVKANIRELIEKGLNTRVELDEIIDADITGGFLLKVEDTFIDGSVKSQLRKIKKELKEEIK